jgi:SOS-response transcriptional repressor LexA
LALFPSAKGRARLTRLPTVPSGGSDFGGLEQAPDGDASTSEVGLDRPEVGAEIGHKRIIALSDLPLSSAILHLPDFGTVAHICAMGRKRIIRREAINPTVKLTVEALYPSTKGALSTISMQEHLGRLSPRDHSPESLRKWIYSLCRQFRTSPTTMAKGAKLAPSTINRFLSGSGPAENLSADTIQKIFDYFLLEIEKEPSDKPDVADTSLIVVPIQVVGHVQAGAWTTALEWPEDQRFDVSAMAPRWMSMHPLLGLEVRGDSMNLVYPEGTILTCIPFDRLDRAPRRLEHLVVAEVDEHGNQESTVKEYQVDRNGVAWLAPRSDNPEHQTPIRLDLLPADKQRIICFSVIGSYRPELA